MEPHSEHTFYAWLIIIGAVCVITIIGALIDRFFLNRRIAALERQRAQVHPSHPAIHGHPARS